MQICYFLFDFRRENISSAKKSALQSNFCQVGSRCIVARLRTFFLISGKAACNACMRSFSGSFGCKVSYPFYWRMISINYLLSIFTVNREPLFLFPSMLFRLTFSHWRHLCSLLLCYFCFAPSFPSPSLSSNFLLAHQALSYPTSWNFSSWVVLVGEN